MSLILIVDDIPAFCEQYAYDLKRLGGYNTLTATSGAQALELLRAHPVDGLILDLEMPGMDGFEFLRLYRQQEHTLPVIVYTSTGDYDRCVRAIKLGAYSFIDKAEPMERVVREIENALEAHRLAVENRSLRRRLDEEKTLLGTSPAMDKLRDAISRIAKLPSPVLILGESGAGKELVARSVHDLSDRARKQFLPINCAALPENLVESELFGHETGAFTGATRMRRGAFETAGDGTLLLDEIGELAAPVQAKLLRVLEEKKVMRLGGTKQISVGTRVLASTNRDLEEEVREGRFREDLLYRINIHVIQVPPLRERRDDIPMLVEHFVNQICREYGRRKKTVEPSVLETLSHHDWKRNNVRELRNVVARMVTACDDETIDIRHLPPEFEMGTSTTLRGAEAEVGRGEPGGGGEPASLKERKLRAEREIILQALTRNDWHITKTATELGLADHSSLLKILRRHDIKRRKS